MFMIYYKKKYHCLFKMKPDSVTEKIMEYVKKISARVSELWWSFTQKIWKFKQKGFSYFNRGDVSDG